MIEYPADTLFWVAHGFGFGEWSDATGEEKRAFNHRSTSFTLLIDGVPQKSALHARLDKSIDAKLKFFVTEIHDGLPAGTYEFTGEFRLSAFLIFGEGSFRESFLFSPCINTVIMT